MSTRAKCAIAIALYFALLIASAVHFRNTLHRDIHRAINRHDFQTVRELIERRPSMVNKTDSYGQTPLHKTNHFGSGDALSMSKYLLEKGADVNARDQAGRTPLHLAVNARNVHVARLLIDNGASVNAKDNSNNAPLAYAGSQRDRTELLKMLLDAGADINQKVTYGGNVLTLLARNGLDNPDTYRFLLDNGADPNMKDDTGTTPLDIATQAGLSEVVDLLQSRDAIKGDGISERSF